MITIGFKRTCPCGYVSVLLLFIVQLTQEVQRTFTMQKQALEDIKLSVEGSYESYAYTERVDVKECCNAQDLYQSYQFTVNVSLLTFSVSFFIFLCLLLFCCSVLYDMNLHLSKAMVRF